MRRDFDGFWKKTLEGFLPEFLEFFFPQVHRDIDWSVKPRFLEQELRRVLGGRAKKKLRSVDSLVLVRLRSGKTAWILIHIEIQERAQRRFSRRMYELNFRISERGREDVVSLALYTGRGSWCPGPYHRKRWGFELLLRFPVATLAACRRARSALESDARPLAVVVLGHLAAQEAGDAAGELYRRKLRLVELAHRPKGGARRRERDIMRLREAIDWLLVLPEDQELRLEAELAKRHRGTSMRYTNIWERYGVEKGKEIGEKRGEKKGVKKGEKLGVKKGRDEEIREAIRTGIRVKFGKAGHVLLNRVERLDGLAQLRGFLRAVFRAESLGELEARLSRNGRRAAARNGARKQAG